MGSETPDGKEQVRTILVMGATGSGKSEAIRRLGGRHVETGNPPETSEGFASCAREWATYDIGELDKVKYHLIDTVGLMDTNRDDEKAVENIAKLLEQLTTVVGVIYVVSGRMHPPEVEICDFLFSIFFHEISPSRLLVLRTRVSRWHEYNAEVEKKNLQGKGYVPERFLEAELIPVDFHPAYGPDDIGKMTGAIRGHIDTWNTYVPQLRQAETPVTFVPTYKKVEQLEKISAANREEKDALNLENSELREKIKEFQQGCETPPTRSQPAKDGNGSGSISDYGDDAEIKEFAGVLLFVAELIKAGSNFVGPLIERLLPSEGKN